MSTIIVNRNDQTSLTTHDLFRFGMKTTTDGGLPKYSFSLRPHIRYGAQEVIESIAKFARPGSDIEITLLSGEKIGYTVLDQMPGHHWRDYSRLREYSPQYREEVLRRWSE